MKEAVMEELGPFLRAAREHRGLNIREAEELSGVSNACLDQIENGRPPKPPPEILKKLSRIYQIPFETLLLKAGFPVLECETAADQTEDPHISILIVDDSPNDRELIRTYLENDQSTNYSIDEAESGEEAFAAIAKRIPDIVFIDYRLPDMDGLEVFARMKKIDPMKKVSVIIMTGQGNEEVAVSAIRLGAVNYLTKDHITEETIRRTVQHAIYRKILLENVRTSALRKREYREGIQKSLADIGTQIRDAAVRLIGKAERLKDDPDILLIMEESAKLTKLIEGEDTDNTSKY